MDDTLSQKMEQTEILLLALEAYLKHSQDLVFVKDEALRYIGASQPFLDLLGLTDVTELMGKTDFDIFPQELARRYTNDDKKILETGISLLDHIEPLPEQNGKAIYSSTSKCALKNAAGTIVGLYGIGRDITAAMQLQEEREQRTLSTDMFTDVLEADLTTNRMLRIRGSAWSANINGNMTYTEAVDRVASLSIHPDYVAEFRRLYMAEKLLVDFAEGKDEFSHITYQTGDNVHYRWMEFKSKIYYSKLSETVRMTTFMKDLDDEIRNKEWLEKQARTDSLTGLLNRNALFRSVQEYLRTEGHTQIHAVLFVDLDNFKEINDRHGHSCGDQVLREVALALTGLFRKDDVIGRVGGDEFMVFLKNVQSEEDICLKMKTIFDQVPLCIPRLAKVPDITCSVGIAIYHADGKSVEELYQQADHAMYQAKKCGKNRIAFYGD